MIDFGNQRFDLRQISDVRDERIIIRALFRRENFINCLFVKYIRAQTVNRFGRKRDCPAALNKFRSFGGRCSQNRFHSRKSFPQRRKERKEKFKEDHGL